MKAVLFALALPALAAPAPGRPLYYWGGRSPIVSLPVAHGSAEPRAFELLAAGETDVLVLRLTFDREIRAALATPLRFSATVYGDMDGDRDTGFDPGPSDLRRGAEWRLEVGAVRVAADPEEQVEAETLVTVTIDALTPSGKRRGLWRGDESGAPQHVHVWDEWLEIRLPREAGVPSASARLVLSSGQAIGDGRLPPR